MENLKLIITIISSGAVSVALSGAVIWLSKNWISERMKGAIQHEYDQKLETHKAQLESQNGIELERLRADLQIAAAERNFRFSHVFEKTAQTIATTHERLLKLRDAVNDQTIAWDLAREEEKPKLVEKLNDEWENFLSYFQKAKLYIPKSTANSIDNFIMALNKFERHTRKVAGLDFQNVPAKDVEPLFETFNKLSMEVASLLRSLEDDFQKILGFPIEEKTKANT